MSPYVPEQNKKAHLMAGPCICCLCTGNLYSTNLIRRSSMRSVLLPSLISWFFSSIRLITIILASSYVSLYLVIDPYLLYGYIINCIYVSVKAAISWNESFPFVQPASTSALVILGFSSLFSSRFVLLCAVIR